MSRENNTGPKRGDTHNNNNNNNKSDE